jgi:hypothetical protein
LGGDILDGAPRKTKSGRMKIETKWTHGRKHMRFRWLAVLAATVLLAGVALAHGDKKHVVGTLEKVNADSVVVKTAAGKSVEVKLVSTTMYVSSDGKAAKLSDLAVGERVVIHATPSGETLSADEVKFSPAGATSAAAASKPKQ